MPQVVSGTTYYLFGGAIVVDEDGNPAENLTGGVVTLPGEVTPLTVLDVVTLEPRTTVTSGPLAFVPAHLVPVPTGLALVVTVDWPGDTIPPQEWYADPSEYVAASPAALAALADAATDAAAAAAAAQAAAAAAQGAAEAAAASMVSHAHNINSLTDVNDTGRADGDTLVWNATTSQWVPGEPLDPVTYTETLANAPAGSVFVINYYDAVGHTINTWPTVRPSTRGDIYFIWRGPSDPGTRVGAHDTMWLVQSA